MTDTTCPSCDAPAPARARACARCGYSFLEDAGPAGRLPRPDATTLAVGAGAAVLVALAIALAIVVTGGGGSDDSASGATAGAHLTVLSEHPLSRRAAERILEERYLPVPDDDEADVSCSGRIPKPAHSVRRCQVHYPGGVERRVVLLTTARGAEVLSKP